MTTPTFINLIFVVIIQVVCPKPIPPSHCAFGQEQRQTAVPLATKNIDRSGKRRATGVKKRLKKSQNLFNDLAIMTVGILKIAIVYGPLYYEEKIFNTSLDRFTNLRFPQKMLYPSL